LSLGILHISTDERVASDQILGEISVLGK
jgi:hypothetical protein